MGRDKGTIETDGIPWRRWTYDLVRPLVAEAWVSCRPDQVEGLGDLPALPDRHPGIGPIAALDAAFAHRPDAAWLLVACDLPGLDAKTLETLLATRDPSAAATAFRASDGEPEPLVAIWEPSLEPAVRAAIADGRYSLRALLADRHIQLVDPLFPVALRDADRPEDL